MVDDPAGQRGRHRDDHALAGDVVFVRPHTHAEAALVDAPHRGIQQHALAELLGHLDRDELRPAVDARLLGAAGRVEVALERSLVLLVTGRCDVEERVQERDLARLGAEDRLACRRHEVDELLVAARVRADVAV